MDSEHIRLFSFHVPGFVPGIPGEFPGGSQALINVETLEVLATGPIGQPLLDASLEPAQQQAVPAPVEEVAQPERGEAASSSGFSFVEADQGMGG